MGVGCRSYNNRGVQFSSVQLSSAQPPTRGVMWYDVIPCRFMPHVMSCRFMSCHSRQRTSGANDDTEQTEKTALL